jgi:phosphohistidine phosphatase
MIVLMRHGLAAERDGTTPDEERALTTEGNARTKRAAEGLALIVPKVSHIISSPLVRATQTALWLAKAYRQRVTPEIDEALSPGAGVEAVDALLDRVEGKRIILVGHEPDLTMYCSHITGLSGTEALGLKKDGCYSIQVDDGVARLEWILSARILRRLPRTI